MGRVLHQVAAEPTITSMKSRRRIALSKAGTTPTRTRLQQGFATGEMGFGGHCKAAILNRSCPLWVKSCRGANKLGCPLYPRKLPRLSPTGASALGHNRTHALRQSLGRFDREFCNCATTRRRLAVITHQPEPTRSHGAFDPHDDFTAQHPEIDGLGQECLC